MIPENDPSRCPLCRGIHPNIKCHKQTPEEWLDINGEILVHLVPPTPGRPVMPRVPVRRLLGGVS